MNIRAAIARPGEPFLIDACTLGEPAANEVLVELEACGVCHTDLSAQKQILGTRLPAVLGHEGVGRIRALGPGVDGFALGDRVLMSFGACGACARCRGEMSAYCEHSLRFNLFGQRVDGSSPIAWRGRTITGHFFGQSSFATHAVVASANLVHLDEDLPGPLMAPLACGVQTGMATMHEVLRVGPGDRVAVFGCGTVGLAAIMAAKIAGCETIAAVDLRSRRLALAEALGATALVCNSEASPETLARALRGITHAFDNTGHPDVIALAYDSLAPRGQLALAGVSPRDARITLDPNRLMASGRSVRGTVEGDAHPPSFVPRMIAWYRSGLLPIEQIVSIYPFAQINEAVADMLSGAVVKPVLHMPSQ
ncbi:NAD(P)-dependent alcohol dehydrogenase [Haliangium ochraceum]|uniref:Alcohol dehydrogenase zinc-binding domain protein n=1 Tax=Haliangium ochraceum (strain DSM 14365 / JCM 11303 / SMP-2) TaxID=502025 RepID=D0LWW7_HALO1|nr:NAD(P)-dependent alcohol dehydrogenase [Haliangium ochraceum]ACY14214.1 Alcohol dehydrogenase zinc-binding domain protein [Haliangium ochraceum DSM 14365]